MGGLGVIIESNLNRVSLSCCWVGVGLGCDNKTLPCVRISAYSSHSVCDLCIALNGNQKMCKNEAELSMSTSLRNQHRMDVGMTRKAVESIRQSAIDFSEDNLFIQCDGNYCLLICI